MTGAAGQGRFHGLLALAAVAAFALLSLPDVNRSLWQDEAFLLHNLGRGFSDYFRPMSFYDQAGPPLTLALLNQFLEWARGEVEAMRVMILASMLIALGSLAWIAARRGDTDYLLGLALVTVTPTAIRYGTEIKHYGFELLASLVLVLAARMVAGRLQGHSVAFAALAVVLSFVSFTAMFIAAAAILEIVLFRAEGKARGAWLAALAGFSVIWIALYLLLFRELLHFQLLNYRDAYGAPQWGAMLRDPALLGNPLIALVRSQPYIAGATAVPAVLVLMTWKRPRFPTRSWLASAEAMPLRLFAILWVMLGVLWLAGLFPFSSERVLLFSMPASALALGLLLRKACERLENAYARIVLAVMVFVPALIACAVLQSRGFHEQQDTRAAHAFMRAHPDTLYVPGFLFEPVLRYYRKLEGEAAPELRVAGWLDPRSEPLASLEEVEARLRHGTLNSHDWRVLHEADAESLYAEWVVGEALRHGSVSYVSAQVLEKDAALLRRAAGKKGCTIGQEFSARGVAISRISCTSRQAAEESNDGTG